MPFQNKTQTQSQKRAGGFGGRGRGRGRGRGGYGRRNFRSSDKTEKKAVFDNRVKYPKTVEDFKTYIAPGSTKWFESRKADKAFWNSTAKSSKETEQRFVTEDRISRCENYSDYLPRTSKYVEDNTEKQIVHPNLDLKGEYYHYEVTPSGHSCTIESNKWVDFWKTRRGKRTAYYISYLNRRRKNRERYERMSSKRDRELEHVPTLYKSTVEQSYNKVSER